MGKTVKPQTVLTLKELIPMYGETKAQADQYDKVAKEQNKDIKALMSKLLKKGETSVNSEKYDGWSATYSIRTSESFNEPALIEFLKKHKEFEGAVKLKEYVDESVLEDLLYNEKVPKKLVLQLDKYRVTRQAEYLTVRKEKDK